MPTLSCILPVYNGGAYLKDAIRSILDQDYSDFELILVDDGSTDKSLEVSKAFALTDSRIRIFARPNSGLVATLNFAIGQAAGSFIARMDADDVAHSSRFRRQLEFLTSNPDCVVVATRVNVIDEHGERIRTSKPNAWCSDQYFPAGGITICHPTTMFRLSAFARTKGYREEFFAAEDYQLWYEMSEHGRICELPDVLLDYRVHSASVSSRKMESQRISCLKADLMYFSRNNSLASELSLKILRAGTISELIDAIRGNDAFPTTKFVELYYSCQLLRRVATRGSIRELVGLIITLLRDFPKTLVSLPRVTIGIALKMVMVEIVRAIFNSLRSVLKARGLRRYFFGV